MKNTANNKPQHTQGEWKILTTSNKDLMIVPLKDNGQYDHKIATIHEIRGEQQANAKRIVKAVNLHDELVNALEDLLKLHATQIEDGSAIFGFIERARKTLNKAQQK
jgi:hypothetical protein